MSQNHTTTSVTPTAKSSSNKDAAERRLARKAASQTSKPAGKAQKSAGKKSLHGSKPKVADNQAKKSKPTAAETVDPMVQAILNDFLTKKAQTDASAPADSPAKAPASATSATAAPVTDNPASANPALAGFSLVLDAEGNEVLVPAGTADQEATSLAQARATNAQADSAGLADNPATARKSRYRPPKLDNKLLAIAAEGEEQLRQEQEERAAQGEVDRSFEQFLLEPALLRRLYELDFAKATDIQAKTIPLALAMQDVLGHAATGTGKTLAFLIPAIQQLYDFGQGESRVLVIAPTRDLAEQIHKQAEDLLLGSPFSASLLIGKKADKADFADENLDAAEASQAQAAFSHDLVIATPGRLANELRAGSLELSQIDLLVLDEVDRTLEIGLGKDLLEIEAATQDRENTLMFTATCGPEVENLFTRIARNNPVKVTGSHSRAEKNKTTQYYYHADSLEHKLELLKQIIKKYSLDRVMVFCKKKETVTKVYKYLMNAREGIRATQIDGDMDQTARARAIGLFADGKVNVIVTTDLLARGIDIADVKAVINFDLPHDGSTMTHRIGRTGRMGKKGLAISLVEAHDYPMLGRAMRFMKVVIPARVLPGCEPTTSVAANALSASANKRPKKKLTKEEVKKQARKAAKEKREAKKTKERHRVTKNKGFPKKFLADQA